MKIKWSSIMLPEFNLIEIRVVEREPVERRRFACYNLRQTELDFTKDKAGLIKAIKENLMRKVMRKVMSV